MASALAIVMGAIVVVGTFSEKAAKGLAILAGAMVIFVAAGVGAAVLGPAIWGIVAALQAFGGVALKIGAMFALIGAGITLISIGFGNFGPAMEKFVNGWVNASKTVIAEAETLKEGMSKAIGALLDGILSNVDKIMTLGGKIVLALIYGIAMAVPQITTVAVAIIVAFIDALASQMQTITDAVFNLLISVFNAVAESIRSYGGDLFAAILNIVSAIEELLLRALAEVFDSIPGMGFVAKKIRSWADGMEAGARDVANSLGKHGSDAIHEGTAQIEQAIVDDTPKVSGAIDTMFGVSFDGLTPKIPELAQKAGIKVPEEFAGVISDNTFKPENATQGMLDGVQSVFDGAPAWTEGGLKRDAEYADGIRNNADKPINAAAEVVAGAKAALDNAPSWAPAGATKDSEYGSGVSSNASAATNAAASVGSSAAKSMNASGDAEKSGTYTSQGFANGLKNKTVLGSIIAAAASIGRSALDTIKSVIKQGSPSKVTTESGMFTGMGFVLGLLSQKKAAISAARDVAKSSTDMLEATVMRAMDIMSNSSDYTPTIRPVLDLANVNAGMTSISSMFNSAKATAIGASVRIGTSDETRYSEFSSAMAKRDTDMQKEFSDLKNYVGELIAKIDNLELRMDGDDVVAGLSNKFSRSIGRSAAIKQRGM